MHSYSVTSRKSWLLTIGIIGICSSIISVFINPIIYELFPKDFIKPISSITLFGVLFFIFDNFLWKWFNVFLKIPNFNGTWKGKLFSTHKKAKKEGYDCEIRIKQTFSKIIVDSEFDNSYSESFVASIVSENKLRPKLVYGYKNNPDGNSEKTMNEHMGRVELSLKREERKITGNYFTNRNPQTQGKIEVKKIK